VRGLTVDRSTGWAWAQKGAWGRLPARYFGAVGGLFAATSQAKMGRDIFHDWETFVQKLLNAMCASWLAKSGCVRCGRARGRDDSFVKSEVLRFAQDDKSFLGAAAQTPW